MKRKGKVFIDANILIHATSYQSADVFRWIYELYEEIYIHKIVLDELGSFYSSISRNVY